MAKEVLMMVMAGCPHCRRAFDLMAALREANPAYRDVPVKVVDETVETAFAATLDYYYVPTFFVDGKKLHEGQPSVAAVEAVFQAALSE